MADTSAGAFMDPSPLRRVALLGLAAFLVLACGGGDGGDRSPDRPHVVQWDAEALDVPFIDQYAPDGRDAEYDGTQFCGPALLAGIAKAYDLTAGFTDAEVVNLLADVAGTDDTGTSGNGMVDALEWMGFLWSAVPGADLDWIDAELTAGHIVIANGDFYEVPGRVNHDLSSGHYVAVTAVGDGWTVYEITDPADRSVKAMTDAQLVNFVDSHPEGGFTISTW